MRFHMVAGAYVLIFSLFYSFTPCQIALLVVLIAAVLTLETINTCIEQLCNLVVDRYEPLVAVIKDAAAGAVLVMSAAAVVVAIIFFWNLEVISKIICFFAANYLLLIPFVLSVIVSIVFIKLGPVGIKNKFFKI